MIDRNKISAADLISVAVFLWVLFFHKQFRGVKENLAQLHRVFRCGINFVPDFRD